MSSKWLRVMYMPPTPLGEDGQRVTSGPEHIALSRAAAEEGMVLLKNEDSILPLNQSVPVALFGKAQADYVKGGGGSGDVTCAYSKSLLDAMNDRGWNLYGPLSAYYRNYVKEQYDKKIAPGQVEEPVLPEDLLLEARKYADTAIVTLCRYSSEGLDRTALPEDGDFYLSAGERAMVSY